MQVFALAAVEMRIRRRQGLIIVHHAVAVVAVAVVGEHEMVKRQGMRASALMKKVAKNQTKCRVISRLAKSHSLNANCAGMKNQTESLAVAAVVDGERQMKSHKKPVVRVVQPAGLHPTTQVGNEDQPVAVAAEENPGVEVVAKVAVGKLFLVSDRDAKTTKKA